MTTMSFLEIRTLWAIAHHEHNPRNGARPLSAGDVHTWGFADMFTDDLNRKFKDDAAFEPVSVRQVTGAMGALKVKGFIVTDGKGSKRDPRTVSFTDAGYVAYCEAFPTTEG